MHHFHLEVEHGVLMLVQRVHDHVALLQHVVTVHCFTVYYQLSGPQHHLQNELAKQSVRKKAYLEKSLRGGVKSVLQVG